MIIKHPEKIIMMIFCIYLVLSEVNVWVLQLIIHMFLLGVGIITLYVWIRDRSNDIIRLLAAVLIIITSIGDMFICSSMSKLSIVSGIVIKIVLIMYSIYGLFKIDKSREEKAHVEIFISQMNPHFTFNALNTIRYYVKTNAELAYDMLYDFAKYFRGNIDALTYEESISILTEIAHLKSYTNIELERFKEKLSIEYELEEVNFKVPPLSVFPIVENAIKHGVRAKAQPGTVVIKSYSDESNFIIEIRDDGPGFDIENVLAETNGNGIKRVKRKLKTIKGSKLTYESTLDKGTKAYIYIPKS